MPVKLSDEDQQLCVELNQDLLTKIVAISLLCKTIIKIHEHELSRPGEDCSNHPSKPRFRLF